MSIHAMIAAAYVTDLDPSTKLVLMAVADSSDEHTREAAPGFPKLRAWAGLSRSRTSAVVAALVESGHLERVEAGRLGRRAVYRVFPQGIPPIPHPTEVAARYSTESSPPVENPAAEGPAHGTLGSCGTPSRVLPTGPLHATTSVSSADATDSTSRPVDRRPPPAAPSTGFPGARKPGDDAAGIARRARGANDRPCPVADHGALGEVAGGCGRCRHAAANSDPDTIAQARATARAATRAARLGGATPTEEPTP